tara:strand:- start:2466 stop:3164 length:699 start_codon:yes stop_codon:yes gene_type:complete
MKHLEEIDFACIGHRGACGHAPENTLASFELAIDMGCPWIELDVYAVGDELVVIHDDDVDRTTNGTGAVMELPLPELRALDAGNGEQIPLLREVCELAEGRCGINIELKGPDTAAPVCALLDDLTAGAAWAPEHFLLSSFRHAELARASRRYRHAPLFGRAADFVAIGRTHNAFSINLSLRLTDAATVEQAHAAGLRVYVYTVNEPADIERMRAIGVDGVFTNYPDRVFGNN